MSEVLMQPLTDAESGHASSSAAAGPMSRGIKVALAALVVFSVLAVGAIIAMSVVLTRSPNVSHVPAQFTGQVVVTGDYSMYSDGSSLPTDNVHPADTGAVHVWTVDRVNNQEELIMSQGTARQLRVYTNGDQAYQLMESASAAPSASCYMYPVSTSTRMHDFSAVATEAAGTTNVDGVTCNVYLATRHDGSHFSYSINPANGAVCQITYASKVYTFKTFSTNIQVGNVICAPGTAVNPSQQKAIVQSTSPAVAPRSIFSDVVNFAKCDTCKSVAHWVIEVAADAGCGALTDGLAAEICGEAVDIGCEVASCDDRICDFIHMC